MSLRNDIVSFWFWGFRGDWRIELQAPVVRPEYVSLITESNPSFSQVLTSIKVILTFDEQWRCARMIQLCKHAHGSRDHNVC